MAASNPGVSRIALLAALADSDARTAAAVTAAKNSMEAVVAASKAETAAAVAALAAAQAASSAELKQMLQELIAGGGTTPPVVTLPTMSISPASRTVTEGSLSTGDLLATITLSGPLPAGVSPTLSPNDGRLALSTVGSDNRFTVRVGVTASGASTTSYTISYAKAGATNTPQQVGFALTVEAGTAPRAAQRLQAWPMEGTGAAAGSVQTAGTAFQMGDLRVGEYLGLRLPDGTKIPVQCDQLAEGKPRPRWPEGSVRDVGLHWRVPAIASGAVVEAELWRETSGPTEATINMATLAQGRVCSIEIKNGSNVFTCDVIAKLADFPLRWFNGPYVAEAHVIADIPRAALGGGTEGFLRANLSLSLDGVLRLDWLVENPFAFDPQPMGDAAYTITVRGEGGVKYTVDVPQASLYSAWGERRAWKADGTNVTHDHVWVRPDGQYLARTGLVNNYDGSLPYTRRLNDMASALTDNATLWAVPYASRNIQTYMPATGGNEIIGETNDASAIWIATGNKTAQRYAMLQAEAAAGIPYRHIERAKGNRWVNPVDRPFGRIVSGHSASQPDYVISSNKASAGQTWTLDTSHWGDQVTVPYLLSGRAILLHTIQAQASVCLMEKSPAERRAVREVNGGPPEANTERARLQRLNWYRADPNGRGLLYNQDVQSRDTGWSERQGINGAAVVPRWMQPFGGLWKDIVDANYRDWNTREAEDAAAQGELHGWNTRFLVNPAVDKPWPDGSKYEMSSWMDDFIAGQDARAARLRFAGARQRYIFKKNFTLGRFLNRAKGFNPEDAIRPQLRVYQADGATPINTWAVAGANLRETTESELGIDPTLRTWGENFSNMRNAVFSGDYGRQSEHTAQMFADVSEELGIDNSDALGVIAFFAAISPANIEKVNMNSVNWQTDPNLCGVRIGQKRGAAAIKPASAAKPYVALEETVSPPEFVSQPDPVIPAGQTFAVTTAGMSAFGKVASNVDGAWSIVSATSGYPGTINNRAELSAQPPGLTAGAKIVRVRVDVDGGRFAEQDITITVTVPATVTTDGFYGTGNSTGMLARYAIPRPVVQGYTDDAFVQERKNGEQRIVKFSDVSGGIITPAYINAWDPESYISKLFDQTGNGLHLTALNASVRPRLAYSSPGNTRGRAAMNFRANSFLSLPNLNVGGPDFFAAAFVWTEFYASSPIRVASFTANGELEDYNNTKSVVLLGSRQGATTARGAGGNGAPEVQAGSFPNGTACFIAASYGDGRAPFVRAESIVVDGPAVSSSPFGYGTLRVGARNDQLGDTGFMEVAELLIGTRTTKADIATINANMQAFYSAA